MDRPRVDGATLRRLMACEGQIDKFCGAFGEGAEVSPENVRRAHELGLDVIWLATLGGRAEYERVRAPARAEYERVWAPAWAEYERVVAHARAELQCGDWAALAARIVGALKERPISSESQ